MPSGDPKNIVVGGGIAGLMAALLLSERKPGEPVVLIERESEVGGLLRVFDYGENGRFDYGMHNIYESGIPELDAIVTGLLPKDQWQISDGNNRDLAGIYFRGKLHTNSPFVDLRSEPEIRREKYVAGFFDAASKRSDATEPASARQIAVEKFGRPITEDMIDPILQKLYRRPSDQLDPMALRLTPLGRILLFDAPLTLELMKSPYLRALVGYPQQRELPGEYVPASKTYYPKEYGIHRVIDALKVRLLEKGVTLLNGAQVIALDRTGSRIESVSIEQNGERQTFNVANLYWTAGPQFIAPLLADKPPQVPFERGARTVVVNLLIDQPPDVDGLYYFYCYEPGFDAFRLTNYTGYCDGAPRNGLYPISLEMFVYEQKDKQALEQQARDEIAKFGILRPGTSIVFCQAEFLTAGFPLPSITNMTSLSTLRQCVTDCAIDNLHMLGILAEPGLFFQGDILKHVYRTFERTAVV